MPEPKNIVRLDHPLFRGSLSLQRTPLYLRFVVKGLASCARNWDALDQLEDTPEPGEQVIAAQFSGRSGVHVDRTVNGRRVGEWMSRVDYSPVADQPPDDVLRDNDKWRAWCTSQAETAGQ